MSERIEEKPAIIPTITKWLFHYFRGQEHRFYDNNPAAYEQIITVCHNRNIAGLRVRDFLKEQIGDRQLDCIVDAACGTGIVTRAIAPLAKKAIGVDLSQGMLDYAACHPSDPGNTEWIQGDFHKLPLGDAIANAYTMIGAARFIGNHQAFFQEMYRVLVPNGIAVMGAMDISNKKLQVMRDFCQDEKLFETEIRKGILPSWYNTVRRIFGKVDAIVLKKI